MGELRLSDLPEDTWYNSPKPLSSPLLSSAPITPSEKHVYTQVQMGIIAYPR